MKKRIFVVIILIIILTTITVLLGFSNKSNDTEVGSEMAIMVQNENNSTQYDKWNNETWPDENQYQLNTTKSNCNNTENVTNILSYSNNNMILTTNQNYRCNLYFDKKKDEPLEITKVEVDTSEYYTVKLTVNATGGSGNYTYDVENTCTYCSQNLNKCWRDSSNVVISTNKNVITISNLQATNYEHNFIIKVKDGKSEASYTVQNVEVESEPCPHGQSCTVSQCEVI